METYIRIRSYYLIARIYIYIHTIKQQMNCLMMCHNGLFNWQRQFLYDDDDEATDV